MKICKRCDLEKPTEEFSKQSNSVDGRYPHCKKCDSDRKKLRRLNNLDSERLSDRIRYLENKPAKLKAAKEYRNREEVKVRSREYIKIWRSTLEAKTKRTIYQKRWDDKNKNKILAAKRINSKKRRVEDAAYKIRMNLSRRINMSLKRTVKKVDRTMILTGIGRLELMDYLAEKFVPGMTWENYGPVWHVDHIKPCSKFNLLEEKDQRACFHYKNLQPLFRIENIKKSNKYAE